MTLPDVLLVDDNDAFRRSLCWRLEASGVQVHEFSSGPELLAWLRDATPAAGACVVSDVRMPGMSGIELLEALRRQPESPPVVFITAHGDVPLAVDAMRRGAAHFIEKPFDVEVLLDAMREACRAPAARPAKPDPAALARLQRLTPRERQVLTLVVAGKLNKIIADELGISIKTVELHRANMMSKLEVRNMPELMRLALAHV